MGLISSLGSIFDPDGQAAANSAANAVGSYLAPGSPYWQAGQLTGDAGIQQGAAGLINPSIGVNTGAVDADAAAYGQLGSLYGGIAQNGGALTKAVGAQAASDLANNSTAQLKGASEQQSGKILAQDQAERNWAQAGATQSRSQVLANQLQKQLWNMAVSHANFEAQFAGHAIQNQDRNTAFDLANTMATNAQGARNTSTTLARQQQAQDFDNAMAASQMIGSMISAGTSTASSMARTDPVSASPGGLNSSGYTASPSSFSGGTGASAGYAQPSTALGSSYNGATQSKYVNPLTGNLIDPNLPTTTASWGDWLTGSSLLA